ncbi:MAG: hypothetical protein U9Q74_12620 [Gemmatimonadota bacterium]|nr:hypothetical protein [Gemmatimonadota bacterium]
MRDLRIGVAAFVAVALTAPQALAKPPIPAFARKYGVSCVLCHAPVPKLNATGEKFAANGFEFEPGEEPRDTVGTGDALLRLQRALPLAVRFDAFGQYLTKSDANSVTTDLQTPWVIKLLSGGQVAHKVSYYTYFLLTERGEVAGLEDAYLQFTDLASSGVSVLVGQFQVSDPLFKRELRLSYDDYQPYRLRVGRSVADLTYDRGLMALWSPWEGGDLAAAVVNGRGLAAAGDSRQYDADAEKNYFLRYSHSFDRVRVGAFGYTGTERQDGHYDRIDVWGPDATVHLGDKVELNLQYTQRRDGNPFFGACSSADPCPGGNIREFSTTVRSGFAEVIVSPQGPAGRLFLSGLFNRAEADAPVIANLEGQSGWSDYVSQCSTASGAVHWLYRRNIRFLAEALWNFDRELGRITGGFVLGF